MFVRSKPVSGCLFCFSLVPNIRGLRLVRLQKDHALMNSIQDSIPEFAGVLFAPSVVAAVGLP
jgi:hypothetical protein